MSVFEAEGRVRVLQFIAPDRTTIVEITSNAVGLFLDKRRHGIVHDYFEQAKGLDNIIWAYHTTHRRGALERCYPGDTMSMC